MLRNKEVNHLQVASFSVVRLYFQQEVVFFCVIRHQHLCFLLLPAVDVSERELLTILENPSNIYAIISGFSLI